MSQEAPLLPHRQLRALQIAAEQVAAGKVGTYAHQLLERKVMAQSWVYKTLAALAKAGLLEQVRDQEHRRRKCFRPTREGYRLLEEHAARAVQATEGFPEPSPVFPEPSPVYPSLTTVDDRDRQLGEALRTLIASGQREDLHAFIDQVLVEENPSAPSAAPAEGSGESSRQAANPPVVIRRPVRQQEPPRQPTPPDEPSPEPSLATAALTGAAQALAEAFIAPRLSPDQADALFVGANLGTAALAAQSSSPKAQSAAVASMALATDRLLKAVTSPSPPAQPNPSPKPELPGLMPDLFGVAGASRQNPSVKAPVERGRADAAVSPPLFAFFDPVTGQRLFVGPPPGPGQTLHSLKGQPIISYVPPGQWVFYDLNTGQPWALELPRPGYEWVHPQTGRVTIRGLGLLPRRQ